MDSFKDALDKKKKDAMKIEIIINGAQAPSEKEMQQTSDRAPEVKDTEEETLKSVIGKDEEQKGREPKTLGERAKAGMRARLKNLKK